MYSVFLVVPCVNHFALLATVFAAPDINKHSDDIILVELGRTDVNFKRFYQILLFYFSTPSKKKAINRYPSRNDLEDIIEQGKILQVHGLSATQYNGSIVAVGQQSSENNITRYACEVIVGQYKHKKLSIKPINLIEIPKQTQELLDIAIYKFSFVENQVIEARRIRNKDKVNINSILNHAYEIMTIVPNCCMLWQVFVSLCKY